MIRRAVLVFTPSLAIIASVFVTIPQQYYILILLVIVLYGVYREMYMEKIYGQIDITTNNENDGKNYYLVLYGEPDDIDNAKQVTFIVSNKSI